MLATTLAEIATRVHHDHQFHEVVVRRSAGALKNENVATADAVEELNHDFAVAETGNRGVTEGNIEGVGDGLGELRIGVARKDRHAVRHLMDHDYAL